MPRWRQSSGIGGKAMIRNGEINMSEIKRILRKYWWILPLTIMSGGALGLGATMVLPKKFTSQARIQIHEQSVSTDLVKPILTEATNARLSSMQEQILSRTQLQSIIERLGLYPSDRGKMHMEDLVFRLRKAIDVTPPESSLGGQSRQLPGFYVNVTFDNPESAQRVCSEITNKFMEQNVKYMNEKTKQAADFLAERADDAKRSLDEQDAKLADFKKKYMGSLPDQQQANLSLLQTMNSQLDAVTQSISRAQQDKAMNESLLAALLGTWKATKVGVTPAGTLEGQLTTLQEQLATLQSRYTAEHPDVIKTKNQIEQLQQRIASAPKGEQSATNATPGEIEPPQIQQMRAKIRQDEMSAVDLTKRQAQIQSQIGVLQGRLQLSPDVEQQFKELTRSYQAASDSYNDLLKRHDQATIAQSFTQDQQGEQFSMEDPPSLPMTPSFPNKTRFAGGGLAGGLALGLAVLYLLAALDSSMHSERDVEVCLKLPVLAMVPTVDPAGKGRESHNGKPKELGFANTRS
jgi:polysaccharide chain length determinant protein (PEP-CTERM system associated)